MQNILFETELCFLIEVLMRSKTCNLYVSMTTCNTSKGNI